MIRRSILIFALVGAAALVGCEKVEKPKPTPTPAPQWLMANVEEGRDYVAIKDGTPFEAAPGKIEVAEVFGYTCPHCAHFEPLVEAWRGKQKDDVKFVAVPAPFGNWWMPYAKAYYAAQELDLADKTHTAMFNAIHVDRSLPGAPNTATDQQIAQFYARFGADATEFARRMESAPVQMKLQRANAFIERTGTDGTPTMIVDGKYRVTGASPEDTLRIVDALVARERAAH
ncbi:thiol:disulfide interchange protein DsbA/DsbL [Cognatilysobacter terrigena]|uniref:thiol:disulfide interchange protein DsbA/DsbL n=1 Tax=Cognatilysobacter terrigena TaxID=2488749 RepID=UPI00105B8042|nr:thiol:disulfide interchange protein DsbA/DsbL [Lysobacter terrigena]